MRIEFKKKYELDEEKYVVDYLASHIDMSKIKIKSAIGQGSLWIKEATSKSKKRIKKIKFLIKKNDFVEFYFDDSLCFDQEANAYEAYRGKEFGVWFKPAGLLSDSTVFSDRGSLSYVIKQSGKKCFLIQRLDREVSGLMIVAYSKKMASFFSKELRENKIKKMYQVQVLGNVLKKEGVIETPLDGKAAKTIYKVHASHERMSELVVEIITGRFHQIRRHLCSIEHPVLGDPKYGKDNKNKEGLQLVAHFNEFFDPNLRKRVQVKLDEKQCLF